MAGFGSDNNGGGGFGGEDGYDIVVGVLMSAISTTLKVPGLSKRKLAKLAAFAKSLGMTPQDYVREVIEDRLEWEELSRSMSTDQILAPFRKGLQRINDADFDRLVDEARTEHYSRVNRKKR
jgi:predicted DNA-binding protein